MDALSFFSPVTGAVEKLYTGNYRLMERSTSQQIDKSMELKV